MLLPILVSAVGFFVTGVFAFAFSDIAVIPAPTQSWLVIAGSALIIFGAELNTPFTTVEVFRKILRHEHNRWDVSALVVSLIGTVVNLLVTFASRLSLVPAWRDVVLYWGPLLSGFAVACDYYGALVELGFLFGSYEVRMETYLHERSAWDIAHGNVPAPELRPAGIDDFRRVLGRLNGQRATLTAEQLDDELAKDGLVVPSKSTGNRWRRMAHREAR